MHKIRWGILSTAKIGREKVIPAMQRGVHCEVAAIASRDEARARAEAERLEIPRYYASYEGLLEDPDIDAIYNPLPNHLHVSWSIRALEAGKHVLCEKPIGLDAPDAERLLEAARAHPRLKVMEAFMYRFHPQWQRARALVREGAIGDLRTIQTIFSYYNVEPDNVRNRADIGGGALMDIGCYGISLARFLFEDEPRQVHATMETDPNFGTDRLTSAILQFDRGTATFTCGTQLSPFQRVQVFGTRGRIEIEVPFNPLPDKPARILLQREKDLEELQMPAVDQFTLQGDLFARAVLEDTPVATPLEDAVANMRVIDAVRVSASSGGG